MSYKINGKAYTENALMDELVYNCKLILDGIVVKNDILAQQYETEETINNAELYMIIKNGNLMFSYIPLTYDLLNAFGYSGTLIRSCIVNRDNVPLKDRDRLVEFTSKYFIDNYEEKNTYYRRLMGLPEYGTNEFDIYIDRSYFPSNYKKEIDFSKPLHEMDDSVINILQSTGKIDQLLNEYKGSNYSYIRFLGNRRIDNYTARKAGKWDILYIPSVENLVKDKFKELYDLNKEIYLKRSYQDAFAFSSDYYDQCMILLVICQTFNDMVVDTPEWYIRRDIFDIRSVQYFLDSYGVAFFKEIPLKYQIRIVKNLNKLIKYKSSNKNNLDILEIFALKNTSIYKYYLYKKRLSDDSGDSYINSEYTEDKYDLEFVQCKMGDTYDNYIKDLIYRTPYDDITLQDKYWDGEDTHEYIKQQHINRDFTIEGTKYMSIEYDVSLSEYLYQMEFFLGLLLDSNIDTDDIKIYVPSIQSGVDFKLADLFLFLYLLTAGYDKSSTKIIKPEEFDPKDKIEKPKFKKYFDFNGGYSYTKESEYDTPLYSTNGGKGKLNDSVWYLNADGGQNVEYSEVRSVEDYYDWMKKYYPELFIDQKHRVFGFNTNADLDKISEIISRRHSQYQFDNGFTLEEMGINNFDSTKEFNSIEDLITTYKNNTECYNNIKNKMIYEVDDRDEYKVYEFVFNSLFTKEFDYNFYKTNNGKTDAEYLEQLLEDKDYILYHYYTKIMSESNNETRQDNIRSIMNDVISTLEYYLTDDSLEYIFAFTTISSFSALIHYIYLMINFFKSYKVYFLDPYVTYTLDDKLENTAGARYDSIAEKKLSYWKEDKQFSSDNGVLNVTKEISEEAEHNHIVENMDIYGHFDPDPDDDYDYDGMYADTVLAYKDANGGTADSMSCIPYFVLNGGRAQGSRRDLWDLNGAGALEMQDYVDVDGGYEFHKDDLRKDYFGKAFTYIIDGGYSSTNQFFTKTMHTKVIDNQIDSTVKISKLQYNEIIENEDGLYIQQNWASWDDFADFKEDTSDTFEFFASMYNTLLDDIYIMSDEDALDKRIGNSIDSYLEGMRKVMDYMDTGTFEQQIYDYTDKQINKLYAEFYNFSPYQWEDF